MRILRYLIGAALLLTGLGWFAFGSPGSSTAQQITTNITVDEQSTVTIDRPSISLDGVYPGESKQLPGTFTITPKRNTSGNYKVMISTQTANFTLGGSQSTISAGALGWKTQDVTTFQQLGTASSEIFHATGPTTINPNPRDVTLNFTCPGDAAPGQYSLVIHFTIEQTA
jgi:hypothetical protein